MRTTQLLLLSTVWCVSLGTTSAFAMMEPDESILSKKATSVRLKDAPVQLLQDWRELGLVKTSPIDVKGGQTLTVTCDFDDVTAPTAISFINSAQNAYYEGGVTVLPGQKSVRFSSVVPEGDTRAPSSCFVGGALI